MIQIQSMRRVIVLSEYYTPGYKAGGPIRSIANIVEALGNEFSFYIVTRDRDLGDARSYPNIQQGSWQSVGKGQVMYLSDKDMTILALRRLLTSIDYDLVYLNGFFNSSTRSVLLLRALGAIPERPVIVAPRGEFSRGALAIKHTKKQLFIRSVRLARLFKGVTWQASSQYEQIDIETHFSEDIESGMSSIYVAPNLFLKSRLDHATVNSRPIKSPGTVRIVSLSRISRKKNLKFALRLFENIQGVVEFDIYGPIEDDAYWEECQQLMAQLPGNVQAAHQGAVPSEQVEAILSQYHLFLFPTQGENFGHVILESLSAGCPILISDQTPWQNLQENFAGWNLPLNDPEAFRRTLQTVINMDHVSWMLWSTSAKRLADSFNANISLVDANRTMFLDALAQRK